MALTAYSLELVQAGLAAAEHAGCESQTVLSLGYPDIIADPARLTELFGPELMGAATRRDDSESIARWHGMSAETPVPEAVNFFALLGYDLEILDVAALRGGEIIHDLNHPVPDRLHRRYALVMDPGTLEHCFNIAQGVKNVAEMVALAGAVFHSNPLNMFNHGFYNLNPTWYADFYAANGFHVESLQAVAGASQKAVRYTVPPARRFGQTVPDSTLYVLARRVIDQPITWPTQTKYLKNPSLKTG